MSERSAFILEGGIHERGMDKAIHVGDEWLTALQWLNAHLRNHIGENVRITFEELSEDVRRATWAFDDAHLKHPPSPHYHGDRKRLKAARRART